MKEIEKFIIKWNTDNEILFYIPKVIPEKLDKIVIRFSPDKKPTNIKDPWEKLIIGVETKSHGLLSISTNESMYNWGIIELKINYRDKITKKDEVMIKTLEWIGGSFLK